MNDNVITIKLEIPGLVEIAAALEKLVGTLQPNPVTPSAAAPIQAPAPLQQSPTPIQTAQYVPQPTMVPTQPAVQQTAPVSQAPMGPVTTAGVPTTAVPIMHTMDELAVAASQLVNMGKQQRLIEILNGFGVNTLTELPQEKYSAFAGCIKAEGAKF